MTKVCGPEKSGGLDVFAGFRQVRKKVRMEMEIVNISSQSDVQNMAIQLNKNAFGLAPATQQVVLNPPVALGSRGTTFVELTTTPNMLAPTPAGQPASPQIQVAIKNMHSGQVFYFAANFNFEALFSPDGAMERSSFIESWKSIDDRNELYGTVSDLPAESVDIEHVQQKFKANNVYFIARRPVPNAEGQEVVYFSMRTFTGMEFLAELTFKRGVNACKVCLKTENASYGLLAKQAIENLLRN
jgi:AP-1 complex subunit beta-1